MWTIYCHTHIASGRHYVGLTKKTMLQRWNQHVYTSEMLSKKGWSHFANAIRKYGREAFTHEVLETCDTLEAANAAEERWIEKLGTRDPEKGFNLMRGGQHVPHPVRNPWDRPEFRKKQLVSRRPPTPERRLQASLRMKTLLSNPEERRKLSEQGKAIDLRPGILELKRARWKDPAFATRCSLGIVRGAERERAKTHCPLGHEYSPENTFFVPRHYRGKVYRTRKCRICVNKRNREKWAIHPRPKAVCACGAPKKKSSKRCSSCHQAHSFGKNEKATWPPLEELKSLVESVGRSEMARRLGVSFQAVTQKLKRHARHSAL